MRKLLGHFYERWDIENTWWDMKKQKTLQNINGDIPDNRCYCLIKQHNRRYK